MHTLSIAFSAVTLSFLAYHFYLQSASFQKIVQSYHDPDRSKVATIVVQRMLGFFLFGITPLLIAVFLFDKPLVYYGFTGANYSKSLCWIALLSAIVILLNYINAPKKDNLAMYPQIRITTWKPNILIISTLTWIAYLAAYEFMFRGFLLFALYDALGLTAAIVINTSIYSLVHVPKGAKEAIGAIPLGIVLCYLTLITGNIVVAFVVHVVMALSNEWFSLRANPAIKIIIK
ncbi:MAG: CPBP family intramembrane glutamic endopeptidase [Bacteroidales bacterium]|nr:CPBP family intramembrane metalloprotease [Bacteroidales bacterium]MDZ4204523.1 CPBP family intramembrane glutamic endopeptidase [Bacteroidales bacterium]